MAVTTYYFSLNASSAPSSTVYVFVSSNLSSTPTKASLVSGQAYLRTTASTYSSLASPVYVWLSSNSSSYVDSGLAFANGRKYATMSTSTTSSNAPLNTVATTAGTNKIDQLEIDNYVYDIDLPVDATPVVASVQTNKYKAPTSSEGSTYDVGSNGQVLTSNGTTCYWATPSGGSALITSSDVSEERISVPSTMKILKVMVPICWNASGDGGYGVKMYIHYSNGGTSFINVQYPSTGREQDYCTYKEFEIVKGSTYGTTINYLGKVIEHNDEEREHQVSVYNLARSGGYIDQFYIDPNLAENTFDDDQVQVYYQIFE